MRLEITLLGGVTVNKKPVSRTKSPLLAYLILNRDHVVPRETLVEEVSPFEPSEPPKDPEAQRRAFRTVLSRLEHDHDLKVERVGEGLRIVIPQGASIDFESVCEVPAQARAALDEWRGAEALRLARPALAQARSGLLRGEDAAWLTTARDKLLEVERDLLECLIRAALMLPDADLIEARTHADELIEGDRTRESAYRLLMMVETSVGSKARAMSVVDRLPTVGVDKRRVMSPATTRVLELVSGDETFPLRLLEAEQDALRDPVRPVGLPAEPVCLGRDDVIRRLVEAVAGDAPVAQPVPVLGGPGVGKTTVLQLFVHRVGARFSGPRYWVDCESLTDRGQVLNALANELEIRPGPSAERIVLEKLASSAALVVLDGAEVPWEADRDGTQALLAILARVRGPALVCAFRGTDPPLGVSWATAVEVPPLTRDAALKVLLHPSGRTWPADDPHLAELLDELDGMPIVIALLARLSHGDPDAASVLRRWRSLGTHPPGDSELRLAAWFELVIDGPRVTDGARRLLTILARLPSGAADDDLQALSAHIEGDPAGVLRSTGLAYKRGDRVVMLKPLADHVASYREPVREDLLTASRHYCAIATRHGPRVGRAGGKADTERLRAERANLMSAIGTALEHDPRLGITALVALKEYAWFQVASMEKLAARAIAVADERNPGTVDLLEVMGLGALAGSQPDRAREHFQRGLEIARRLGDAGREAASLLGLAEVALRVFDDEGAREHFVRSLELFEQVPRAELGRANCILGLGQVALRRMSLDEAARRFAQALAIYEDVDVHDDLGSANCIRGLGDVAFARSQYERATDHFEDARMRYDEIGHVLGLANALRDQAESALATSDPQKAQEDFGEALQLHRDIGDVLGQANCELGLGAVMLARGDAVGARERFATARRHYREVGCVSGEAACLDRLAATLADSDPAGARHHLRQVVELHESVDDPYSLGRAHLQLAALTRDAAESRAHVRVAWGALRSIGREDLARLTAHELLPLRKVTDDNA